MAAYITLMGNYDDPPPQDGPPLYPVTKPGPYIFVED